MTTQVNIHEAKTHLSRLLEAVERGEEVVIARAGKPVATLSAYKAPRRTVLPPGNLLGTDWTMSDDFEDPLELALAVPGDSLAETATPYHPAARGDEPAIADLLRRAATGEDVVVSTGGSNDVRLMPIRRPPDAEAKKRILAEFRAAASRKVTPGPSAARSQDFLYDEDGLPG